jgi:hypothetical protein
LVIQTSGTYSSAADKYLLHVSLSTGQLNILEHETTKYTPNDLLMLFIKDLFVMGNQYFWWASKV